MVQNQPGIGLIFGQIWFGYELGPKKFKILADYRPIFNETNRPRFWTNLVLFFQKCKKDNNSIKFGQKLVLFWYGLN